MQRSAWLKRTVAVWPSLPFAALGFILAWNMLAFTGAVWVSSPDVDSIYRKQQYIISTASFALTLLAIAIFAEQLERFVKRPVSAIVGGAIGLVGSALIVVVGPYIFGTPLAQIGINQPLYYTGCVLAGIGNALVMVRCAGLYGRILPRNTIVRSAQALITAVMLYFLATGFPSWRFNGDGPLVMGTGAFVTIPLIAGMLVSLSTFSTEAHDIEADSSSTHDLPQSFWRMVIVVSVLSFAASLVSGYANAVVSMVDSALFASLVIILQIPVALLFVAFAVTYDAEKRSFGFVFTTLLVVLAFAIVLAPTLGRYYTPYYQIVPFAVYVFSFIVRCVLFFVIFQRKISARVAFGFGYGFFSLADSAGWLVGSLLLPGFPAATVMGVSVGLAFMALAGAFLLFSNKEFDDLFESVAQGQDSLSSLMERQLESTLATTTQRGKFKVAIDVIADEYGLSRREKDVLRHLAMGHGSTRIAEELGVSWNTVRTHTRNLYAKLDVHSKQEVEALVDAYK